MKNKNNIAVAEQRMTGSRAGAHKNKSQRGKGKGKGKYARHPKHKSRKFDH